MSDTLPDLGSAGWRALSLSVRTDQGLGGRWTSLAAGGREWLWRNPDAAVLAARGRVSPGAAFVDAGGVEECLPTVDGLPDHGAVWSRPWERDGGADRVVAGALRLTRTITVDDGAVSAAYSIAGPPGTPFVHAVHALLEVGPLARLLIPTPQAAVVSDSAVTGGDVVARPDLWPPTIAGTAADRLGPVDGTAVAVLLPGCHTVAVVDGTAALEVRWWVLDTAEDDPCSLLVWRNLGGWPAGGPYRSIGIEPMVGRTTFVGAEGSGGGPLNRGAVRLPGSGRFGWQVHITAWRCPQVD